MSASPTNLSAPRANSRTRTICGWACVAAYTTLLTVASLLPAGQDAPGGWDSILTPTAQNVLHFPAYAVLTGLLLTAADRSWRIGSAGAVTLLAACILYGAILEWLQAKLIPGRFGDWADVLWNTTGGAGGCLCWLLFRNMFSPTESTIRNA